MARSIVSSLFRRMPGPESDAHVSPSSDPGSHISSQSRGRRPLGDQIEELEEIEMKSDKVIGTNSLDGSGKKVMAADINLETFSDEESELSETAKKLENLSRDEQSFSKRINEWIKTVSIRDEMDTIKRNYDVIVHKDDADDDTVQTDNPTKSPSVENKSILEKTNYEQSEVSEFEDDQPSGLTSPAPVLMVSNFTDVSDDQEEIDTEDYEELKKKFQAERNSFVPSTIIPTVALQSFEQGFANVQKSNGNLLFENGIGRSKMMTNLPMTYPSVTKNYHFKILETTEQKMKILRDGTRQVDTTHTREQSENVYDGESSWMRCGVILKVFLVIILCSVLVTGYFYRVHEGFELYCHISHSHDSIEEGKVSIEL